jgi:glutamate synthase domain-containing protein 3
VDDLNCDALSVREVNHHLQQMASGTACAIRAPRGKHNLGVGLTEVIDITIEGNAGYFVGGLGGRRDGTGPKITVDGFVGWSVGENLMGGTVRVRGSASQSAASSARGGTVVVEGDASLRAGISLKGATLAVAGDVGAMAGFMAQSGTILVGGDAGHGLGDSLYEAVIYVGGTISSLGADATVEEMVDDDILQIKRLVELTGFDHIDPGRMTKVVSARTLYHFSADHHGVY